MVNSITYQRVFRIPYKKWSILLASDGRWGYAHEEEFVEFGTRNSCVPLLPLLELAHSAAVRLAREGLTEIGAISALDRFPFEEIVLLALAWETAYWPRLAIRWIEEGYPASSRIMESLRPLEEKKHLPQALRHQAKDLVNRLEYTEQKPITSVYVEARVGTDEHYHYWKKANLQGCRLRLVEKGSCRVPVVNEHDFGYWMVGQTRVPAHTLLTFFDGCGEITETPSIKFWTLQANPDAEVQTLPDHHNSEYYVRGRLEVLAHGVNSKAGRLQEWWLNWAPLNGGQVAPVARWLGEQIKTRYKTPRSCPQPICESDQDSPVFNPVEGWSFETDIKEMKESIRKKKPASLAVPPTILQVDDGSESSISVHDNIVYGYLVTCDDWSSPTYQLVLHTEYFRSEQEVEYTDIVFSNVTTHRFETITAQTVIFDIEETSPQVIYEKDKKLFLRLQNYGWPFNYKDSNDLFQQLSEKGVRAFRIQSSCGLDGWVWAEKMELIPREKRKEFN